MGAVDRWVQWTDVNWRCHPPPLEVDRSLTTILHESKTRVIALHKLELILYSSLKVVYVQRCDVCSKLNGMNARP